MPYCYRVINNFIKKTCDKNGAFVPYEIGLPELICSEAKTGYNWTVQKLDLLEQISSGDYTFFQK